MYTNTHILTFLFAGYWQGPPQGSSPSFQQLQRRRLEPLLRPYCRCHQVWPSLNVTMTTTPQSHDNTFSSPVMTSLASKQSWKCNSQKEVKQIEPITCYDFVTIGQRSPLSAPWGRPLSLQKWTACYSLFKRSPLQSINKCSLQEILVILTFVSMSSSNEQNTDKMSANYVQLTFSPSCQES